MGKYITLIVANVVFTLPQKTLLLLNGFHLTSLESWLKPKWIPAAGVGQHVSKKS